MKRDDVREAPAGKGHRAPTPVSIISGQQELNEKVARLCGLIIGSTGYDQHSRKVLDYCNDRNAMSQARQLLTEHQWYQFVEHLVGKKWWDAWTFEDLRRAIDSEPTEQAKAFIAVMEGRSE